MKDNYMELNDELHELSIRYTKLGSTLGSEYFETLIPEHAGFLQKQYHHMHEYKNILEQRIALLRNQG